MHPSSLDSVLQRFFEAMLEEVHTITVGRIESYSGHDTRMATVLPLVNPWLSNGEVVQHKPIAEVPVVFPSTATAGFILPIKKGDLVLLLFAEQGIGEFLSLRQARPVDADSPSKFGMHDCIAIPGVFPFKMAPKVSIPADAVGVVNGDTTLVLNPKTFSVTDGNGNSIVSSSDRVTINGALEVLK